MIGNSFYILEKCELVKLDLWLFYFKPLTPMSDQERISPYNINTISIQYQYNINQINDENKEKY